MDILKIIFSLSVAKKKFTLTPGQGHRSKQIGRGKLQEQTIGLFFKTIGHFVSWSVSYTYDLTDKFVEATCHCVSCFIQKPHFSDFRLVNLLIKLPIDWITLFEPGMHKYFKISLLLARKTYTIVYYSNKVGSLALHWKM